MKLIKKYISPIITAVVILLFGIYLYRNPQIINELLSTRPIYIVLIMGIYLGVFFFEGLFIKTSLGIFEKKISVKESFFLATVSRIGNYLLPMRAGAMFRATYLKKKYEFPYSNFLSTFYGYYVIFFLTNSVISIGILLFKYLINDQLFLPLILFFSLILLGMLILIFVRIPFEKIIKTKSPVVEKIFNFINKFIKGWDLIVKDRKDFLLLVSIALGNILLNVIIVLIEFNAIEKVPKVLDVILYTAISGVSLLISITPGSLGIREGIFLLTSESLGLTEAEIMKLAFLDRGVMFLLLFICLVFVMAFSKKITLKEVFFGKEIR